MPALLDIITVTKDDLAGISDTLSSTRAMRATPGVRQLIVDGSMEVADEVRLFTDKEANADYLWQEPAGIAAAFNLGISRVSAQWVWFLNGRDRVHPKLDGALLMRILAASRADIIIFDLETIQSGYRRSHPPIWAQWPLSNGNWIPHPATFIRRTLFEQYGRFDTSYRIAMDAEWWARVFEHNVLIDMLSIPVVQYDEHGISSSNLIDTRQENRRILSAHFNKWCRWWLSKGWQMLKARLGQ